MRQIAIFNEMIKDAHPGMLQINPETIQSFSLNYIPVTCGMVNVNDTAFDAADIINYERVLVQKQAFSCNYRDKSLILTAKQAIDNFAAKQQVKYFALGSEFVGEVVAVGAGVTQLAVGDRVIGNGSYPYSEHENAKPGLPTNHGSKELEVFHFGKLIKIPDSMPMEVAASFPIGGQTVYSMIRKLELQPGEKVLVTAATSNTSLFAINALKQLPVRVFALTTRPDFERQLKDLGVEEVFVVKRGLPHLLQDPTISKFVSDKGAFNAVIDPFFDIYLHQVMHVIALEGRYVTCGMYHQPHIGGQKENDTQRNVLSLAMLIAMTRNIKIIGNCIGKTEDLERAMQDYADGKLEVIVDSVYREHRVQEFFERSFNSTDRFGKVVFAY
jgi:NADPH:quinone reductase-like Zn-dependent oxidoreductase